MISAGNLPQLRPLFPLNRHLLLCSQQGPGNVAACCFPPKYFTTGIHGYRLNLGSIHSGGWNNVAETVLVLVVAGLLLAKDALCNWIEWISVGLTEVVFPSPALSTRGHPLWMDGSELMDVYYRPQKQDKSI